MSTPDDVAAGLIGRIACAPTGPARRHSDGRDGIPGPTPGVEIDDENVRCTSEFAAQGNDGGYYLMTSGHRDAYDAMRRSRRQAENRSVGGAGTRTPARRDQPGNAERAQQHALGQHEPTPVTETPPVHADPAQPRGRPGNGARGNRHRNLQPRQRPATSTTRYRSDYSRGPRAGGSTAGVATVSAGTCANVVTVSNWLICATAR